MEDKIRALIIELERENRDRSTAMEDSLCPEYTHTMLRHKYNNTLDIIKRLKSILLN